MLGLKEHILIFRVQKLRDREAFGVLYETYADRIARFLSMKVGDGEVVADLLQEVFFKAWKYLMEDEAVEHPQALFFRIARTTVIDHYRRTDPEALSLDDDNAPEVVSAGIRTDQLDAKRDVEKVRAMLGKLRASYREAIQLRYFEEMSIDEIAQALDKTPGTVRVLVHRAVTALEDLLAEESRPYVKEIGTTPNVGEEHPGAR
ncbi:MAG: sigma-70 family RNA polymerase sigma factor [bacterium]